VEAWANYDLSGMTSVSTKEMSEGMVNAYFRSFLNSLESMRQITAEAEGIPVASVSIRLGGRIGSLITVWWMMELWR